MDTLSNLNIERAVLSSIIYNHDNLESVSAVLKVKDFYLPFHQHLFGAMLDLERVQKPVDEEFLRQELLKNDQFDENGFIEILTANPLSNIKAYSLEIKEKAVKRALVKLSSHISTLINEEDQSSSDVLDEVQKRLYEVSVDTLSRDFQDSKEMILSTMSYIEEMKARGESLIGLDTGYKELNDLTAGFGKGDLIIVAARPAMGKTAFTLNLTQNVLDHDKGVAFFSLEMPAEQLMLRMLSAKTSISLQSLRVGNMNDDELGRLSAACDVMSKKKLFVDDDGNLNIHQLRSKLRKLKQQHPEISLAVIDYLQLMTSATSKDRHLEVSEISRGLKLLARELEIPIIALSQLNRGLESRADKRPMLSDLRESGAIEQDADTIMFVYRDDVYRIREEKEKEKRAKAEGKEYTSNFQEKPEEEAEIIIGKQRNGPTGIVNLIFQKKTTRFVGTSRLPTPIVYEDSSTQMKEAKIDIVSI
jgi:replicative DNA helicase